MNRFGPTLGILGALLGLGGMIFYTLYPEKLLIVTAIEGLALIGLTLFFVANLDYLRAFSGRRTTKLGAGSVVMVILFIGILTILNFLGARHSTRWDFSETQHFTLAPQTYRVLRSLNRDVKILVFTQERSPGFTTFRDLLDSYQHASPKLKVEFIDPDRKPNIARQYGITRPDTAVIETGEQSTRVTVPSEAEITGALVRMAKEGKKRIVFVEGHGERGVNEQERGGLSLAKEAMVKQGYEVETLSLLQQSTVPDNTSVLVLAGPRRPVTKEEQDQIAHYVAQGGHLLILLDPESEAALDPLLAQWGVEPGKGVLIDLEDRLAQGDLTALMIRTFTEHEITQDFTFAVLFPLSRHLVFHEESGKDWDFVALARTSPRSWADMNMSGGKVAGFTEGEDIKGPLPLAAALTPKKPQEEGKRRAAIVVVGNSSFASNSYINFPGNTDFLLHALGWLAEERDLISITPKEPAFRPFIPNPLQERTLLYVQVLALPVLTFAAGIRVWRKRRRL